MKNLNTPAFILNDDDESENITGLTVGNADWKESPGSVLESVDYLLKEHGLEIVTFDSGGDSYEFAIQKRG